MEILLGIAVNIFKPVRAGIAVVHRHQNESSFGRRWLLVAFFIFHSFFCIPVLAQPYSVNWFKVAGGGGTSSGGGYAVNCTFGQPDAGGPMQGGGFSVVGGFWSPLATYTLNPNGVAPAISNGYYPIEVVTLTNSSLVVGVTGTPPLYYQWQKNGTNLHDSAGVTGATNSTLLFDLSNTNYPGNYQLFVVSPYGSVTSAVVTISKYGPPQIISQPTDITATAGSSVGFNVYATGNPAPRYRWNGLTNADALYPFYNLVAWDSGGYQVMITNLFGSVVSRVASLTVTDRIPPSFIQQPQSVTNALGSTVTFSAATTNNPPAYYQWYLNGTNFVFSDGGHSGGYTSSSSYQIYTATIAGLYSVVAANRYGSATSSVAMLVLTNGYGPTILTQPQSRTNVAGTIASFSVAVNANPPPNYTWRFNGTTVANYATSTYSFVAAVSGNYDVVVANYYGSITSSVATLTVTAPVNGATDLINFDDLGGYIADQTGNDNSQGTAPIPAGYHGLTWNNFRPLNAVAYVGNPSGYGAGLVSASNVAFNFGGYSASISNTNAFDLVSGNFTAAWNDNLQLQVVAKVVGGLLYSNNYVLSATTPMLINFNYLGITNVTFTSSGGTIHTGYGGGGSDPTYSTHFTLDNLTVRSSGGLYFITSKGSLGFTTRQFLLTLSGPVGSNAVISASTNLQTWVPLVTNPLTLGSLTFTDTLATNFTRRFYRATLQP